MSPAPRGDFVVTYHSISPGRGSLHLAPEALASQLDWLLGCGFRPAALGKIVADLEEGASESGADDGPMRFALTFDDGYRDFLDAALPVLEARGLPATLFIVAAADRSRPREGLDRSLLPLEALADLAPRGVSIGAHSVGHVDLRLLDDTALERELADARRILEAASGAPVELLAYPFGAIDLRVRAAAARHYRAACTTRLARVFPGTDPLAIPRIDACYLGSPLLRALIASRRPDFYLELRHRLRRLRGSERSSL